MTAGIVATTENGFVLMVESEKKLGGLEKKKKNRKLLFIWLPGYML